MPSLLRIVGFALAVLLVVLATRRLRRHGTGSRVPAATLLVVGLALGTVSIAPDIVRPIQSVLGLPTHVLVIDDGSTDATSATGARLGAQVVRHPVNSGQGAALQTGYLVAERLGVDVVVTLDADGQHDPAEIERLVGPIVRD